MDNSNIHILIVDDTPKNLQVLGNMLMEQNYQIEYATNGIAALEWVTEKKFDLILLDIMMPEMDGYEVCRKIKEKNETKDIPIIFLTAKIDAESIVQGFELGASDYVAKPFNKKELLARINTQITLRKSQEELKEKNKLIIDSLNYAQKIQHAMLPEINLFDTCFSEYFIFYKPSYIVSGDFYWIKQIKNYILFAAADCTGHGVPGAFMSMLGISLLNEIIGKSKIGPPNEILKKLRKKIKDSLHQTGQEKEQKDGMDIAFCMLDTETLELQYAGAYNPLYLIKNKHLIEYKADRQPIGIYEYENDFSNQIIQLQKNDCVYIFSDGFADQIGGPELKKFKTKYFKQLLLEINHLPMPEQKKQLEETFIKWKNELDQIDDIIIIGLKI